MEAEVPQLCRMFIDTDMGVDDAVAVAWLLAQPSVQIVGFSTVFGNASVEHTTTNLLTLLDAAERRIPVTVGANAPLVFAPNHLGAFVHGPDGFWFAQTRQNLAGLPHDAPDAIARAARQHPGLTLLALGPLTNIARAVQTHPGDFENVRLVALSGARHGGNVTPIAEFNAFTDPHALEVVLSSRLRVELVMADAFDQAKLPDSQRFVAQLGEAGGTVAALLANVLARYIQASTLGMGGPASIPDLVAAAYALYPGLGTPTSALVHVITDGGIARGQTIVASTLTERVALIAGAEKLSALAEQAFMPNFDMNREIAAFLASRPDNAHVILEVAGQRIMQSLELALTSNKTHDLTIER
jgi:inosine-uridine nucleoside N-ribohydrolase